MFQRGLSIAGTFCGLLGALVGHHFILESDQDLLEGGLRLPVLEDIKIFDPSIALVDTGDVYLCHEGNLGRLGRVVRTTDNLETINPAIEAGLHRVRLTL